MKGLQDNWLFVISAQALEQNRATAMTSGIVSLAAAAAIAGDERIFQRARKSCNIH